MGNPLHNELRKEFQLERLILFSDAVFAIAITLLVIEIKIPEVHEGDLTDEKLMHSLAELAPKFIGFLVSFFIIGQYWAMHHRMFGYVINFNPKLLRMNLLFLFGIALMPFSTGFYSEYAGHAVLAPSIFYICNIIFLGWLAFTMWRYLGRSNGTLAENLLPDIVRYSSRRAITVPVIFILMTLLYSWKPMVAAFTPALIPVANRVLYGKLKKKIVTNSTK